MNVLIFGICITFVIIILRIDNSRIYNPLVLFNFWWGITILVSGFGFYDLYVPENKTYFIMLIGVISYNFSGVLYFVINKKTPTVKLKNEKRFDDINKILLFLHVPILIELLRRSFVVLNLLKAGMSYQMIRYEYFYGNQIMPGYSMLIDNWLVDPLIIFSIIITALHYFNKNFNKKLLVSTIVLVGLTAFSSGSRNIILMLAIIIVIAFFITRVQIKIDFKKRIKLFSLLLGIGIAIYFITGERAGIGQSDNEMFRTMVSYFSAPYIYFEKLSKYAFESGTTTLYGFTFLGGLWDVFIFILKIVGLNIETISSHIGEYNQLFLEVGYNRKFNAFPTMIYTFMYDLGILGVILGPLFFGLFSNFIYLKMVFSNSLIYRGMYIMVCIMIYESVMRWVGTSTSTWVVFLLFIVYGYVSQKKYNLTK